MMHMSFAWGRAVAVLLSVASLSGCASSWPQTAKLGEGLPSGLPVRVELTAVPFFPQVEYQCGPAALATALASWGVSVTPDDLVSQVYIPRRKGSLQIEMMAAARRHGLVSYELAPRFEDLLREIAAGTPVIVLQNLGFVDGWHYAVAIGYDYERGELVLRSGETERKVLRFPVHEMVWKRSGYWAMVAVPPERIPATAEESRWLSAIAALERTGDAKNARTAYASFRARWPENVDGAIGLANAHHALGELREAETVLRDAHRRAPVRSSCSTTWSRRFWTRGAAKRRCLLPSRPRPWAARSPRRWRKPGARFSSEFRYGINSAVAARPFPYGPKECRYRGAADLTLRAPLLRCRPARAPRRRSRRRAGSAPAGSCRAARGRSDRAPPRTAQAASRARGATRKAAWPV